MGRRDSHTRDLFEVPQPAAPAPGGMDYRAEVSGLVSGVLRGADGDRYEVAGRMSRLTGRSISKLMLDAYSAEGRETFNLPCYLVPALEVACSTHAISNWLVGVRGGRMLLGRDALNAELGKLERLREDAAKQIRALKRVMGEMG